MVALPCLLFLPVMGLILIILMVVFGFLPYRQRTRRDQVAGAKMCTVAELKEGPAKMRGRIVAQERLLQSPLSREPCVYYRFVVEEQHSSYNGRTHTTYWVTVIDDAQSIDVTVQDRTGEIDLDLRRAEVMVNSSASLQSGTFNSPPPRIERLLHERYGKSTHGWLFNKTMRYSETVLGDDDEVVIVGTAKVPPMGNKYFTKGDLPFIVSDKSPKELVDQYGWWATFHLVVLIILGVLLLLSLGAAFLIVVAIAVRL
jgi:hypothetical protein